MSEHLAAIAARVSGLGIDVYDTAAERPDYDPRDWLKNFSTVQQSAWVLPDMYAILTAPALRRVAVTLPGGRDHVRDYFQLTVVGLSAWQVRHWNSLVRGVLDPAQFRVGNKFQGFVSLSATGISALDREVTPYRYYAVDTYRYHASPL